MKVEEAERARLYQAKADQLLPVNGWGLQGRLAVSDKDDGGSGNFRWSTDASDSHMDFHGALGRGAWTLEANQKGAEITLADGAVHRAESVEQLVQRVVGWKIPVESLAWWVRGLAEPGPFKQRDIDDAGNISNLVQNGWAIVYDRYRVFDGLSLPTRMTARKAEWKVKLAVKSWTLDDADDVAN